MLHLAALGLDHHVAPVAVRERLYWAGAAAQRAALSELAAGPLAEVALLCTCNRTDVYLAAEDPAAAAAHVTAVLARRGGWPPERVADLLYRHVGAAAAATHLCRVACGLESLVLGETQVLAQVKEAYLRAGEAGTVGKLLHGLFHHALACAKRVHHETALAAAPVSVGAAAAAFARRTLGPLACRTALLLGAGETAETVARRLREAGIGRLVICNRTPARAEALAARAGGEVVPAEELQGWLERADVLVCSTAAERPVITAAAVGAAVPRRGGRPLLVLDLAVPRDVEPDVGGLPGVRLCDVDALEEVAAEGRADRAAEATRAEAVVAEEVAAFEAWLRALDVVPVIRALRARFQEVGRAETERALARLGDLGPREQAVVRRMGYAIVQKLLDRPVRRMRETAGAPAGVHAVRALADAFGLDIPPLVALPGAAEAGRAAGGRRRRVRAPVGPAAADDHERAASTPS